MKRDIVFHFFTVNILTHNLGILVNGQTSVKLDKLKVWLLVIFLRECKILRSALSFAVVNPQLVE